MNPFRLPPAQRAAAAVLITLAWCGCAGRALAAGACTVSSTGLAFGRYQPVTMAGKLTSDAITSDATVSVVCTAIAVGGSYTVSLGAGSYGPGDRISVRYLNNSVNGGDPMAYNVYTGASYVTVWGNGSIGSLITGSIPTGDSNQSHTVYGKVPASQTTLKAGSYGDSMTMTITYNP